MTRNRKRTTESDSVCHEETVIISRVADSKVLAHKRRLINEHRAQPAEVAQRMQEGSQEYAANVNLHDEFYIGQCVYACTRVPGMNSRGNSYMQSAEVISVQRGNVTVRFVEPSEMRHAETFAAFDVANMDVMVAV